MFQPAPPSPRLPLRRVALLLAAALALAGCQIGGAPPALPTEPAGGQQPTVVAGTPPPSAQPGGAASTTPPSPAGAQQIVIDSPPPGTSVGSPLTVTGRTARPPAGNSLSYTLRDAGGGILGSGVFPVTPAADGSASFNASLTFNLPPGGGVIGLELFEPGAAGQPVAASALLELNVAPPQAIVIDSPPPGTNVGSPVVITGRTTRYPFQGNLGYRVLDAGGRELGIGTFPVAGTEGEPASFNSSINFSLPPGGGRISVEIVDQNAASGQIAAAARLDLNVAAPQQAIVIESPPANTVVGSPVTVTGRTTAVPTSGALTYRVRDAQGAQIGQGQFGVTGAPEGGTRFNAQVFFTPPPGGGPVGLELLDLDPATNQARTSTTLTLQVAAAPATATPLPATQAVIIDTPPAGTVVGSPVVITGRTALPPRTGKLFYTVRGPSRETLGQGEFPVALPQGLSANFPFVASLAFAEPPQGGAVIVEIYDRDAVGNLVASAFVQLQANPRGPVPATPTALTGGQASQQQVLIDTPPPGTTVGSPVVITGRTALPPVGGELDYRVLDAAGNVLGEGSFRVPIPVDARQIPFTASIIFNEPPQGGAVRVVIADIDNGTRAVRAEAQVDLTVSPRP